MNRITLSGILGLIAFVLAIDPQVNAQNMSPLWNDADAAPEIPLRSPDVPFSSPWSPGNVAAPSLNGVVHAIAQRDDELYVGGEFSLAGDVVAGYVVRWDGTAWIPLGGSPQGVDGPVETLLVDGDKVYVGGNFTQAGSLRTRNIAVWNRTTNKWSALGGGVGGTLRNSVHAIAVHNGQIYVGGSFIAAGTTVAAYIARWDGRRWHRVGTGVNNAVRAFHIQGDYLYVGGDFTIAGDKPAMGLARYNLVNGEWENAGVDIPGSVAAITEDERYMYVGGVFEELEGQVVNNIIRIDKQSGVWSPMLQGVVGYDYYANGIGGVNIVKGVEEILVEGDHVYVSGTLTQALVRSGDEYAYVGLVGFARWDGENWSNFGRAANPESWPIFDPPGTRKNQIGPPNIYALHSRGDGTLMLGGDFDWISDFVVNTPAPFLCTFSIADSSYSTFENATARREEYPSSIATFNAPRGERTWDDLFGPAHRMMTRPDVLNAASESRIGSSGSLPSLPFNSSFPVPDDINWQPVGTYTSNDNGVLALASEGGEVFAGGTFASMFGVEANGIAMYKERGWWPLDDGMSVGVNGFVYAITVSGSKVYVGGQFSKAGGIRANNIAVWDRSTSTWSAIGDGISGDGSTPAFVSEILVLGNEVFVGGNFIAAGGTPAGNIARWNGSEWSPLGTGINGTVNALEHFKGKLYAGGSFSQAGAINSNAVAYWDGEQWNGMDGGLNGYVNDIITYATALDTSIVIGGQFIKEFQEGPDGSAQSLVWWSGTEWVPKPSLSPLEPPFIGVNGEVRKMVMVEDDLFVVGSFNNAFPRGTGPMAEPLYNIAFFNYAMFGTTPIPMWHSLKGGLNGNANAITVSGRTIIAAGDFTRTGNRKLDADHVVLWSLAEHDWAWAGNPTAMAPVQALAMHDDTLYAAGSFMSPDVELFNITNYLVRLTQIGWRIVKGEVRGTPFALNATADNEFFSGGSIISTDGRISVNIARWNAQSRVWKPLTAGSGVASLEDISFVSAIAGDRQKVYVGGDFDIADTITARNIAVWDRTDETWQTLGSGLNGTVLALVLDTDGTLYAGGSFNKSGSTTVNHVARWDGTKWHPLGAGIDGNVFSLTIDGGGLYVGGEFREAGGETANNVARWDIASQTWSPLGDGLASGFESAVYTLGVSRGRLFAAGKFDIAGHDSSHNIARWSPGGWWEALGSGTDRVVNSIAIGPTGIVYAGGYFLSAGAKPLKYVASWKDPTLSVGWTSGTPAGDILREGAPNPFTENVSVTLTLPEGSNRRIALTLFDATGREIRRIIDADLSSGDHTLSINGGALNAGIYILRLQCGETVESVKLIKW